MESTPISIADVRLFELKTFEDQRGWLSEVYRMDEIDHTPAMAYISVTRPGLARGPHEHRLQTDLFAFTGPGDFQLYLYDARPESPTHGQSFEARLGESRPAAVLIPPRVIHAYRCVSEGDGTVLNLPDKLYAGSGRSEVVDEVRHEDNPQSPFFSVFDYQLFINE